MCGLKKDNNENNYKGKELEFLDDTSLVETEYDVCDKKNDNIENNDKEK